MVNNPSVRRDTAPVSTNSESTSSNSEARNLIQAARTSEVQLAQLKAEQQQTRLLINQVSGLLDESRNLQQQILAELRLINNIPTPPTTDSQVVIFNQTLPESSTIPREPEQIVKPTAEVKLPAEPSAATLETKKVEIISEIQSNFAEQPENLKDFFTQNQKEIRDTMFKVEEIDGKIFCFSKNIGGKVYALVKEKGSNKYKMVFFRESGSDRQFKSLPSYRKGGISYSKGDESNKNHHYVQSAKLDPRISEILDQAPQSNSKINLKSYIPAEGGKYPLDFTENYYEFKNTEMAENQRNLTGRYKLYNQIMTWGLLESKIKISEAIKLAQKAIKPELKERFEQLIKIPGVIETLQKMNVGNLSVPDFINSQTKEVGEVLRIFQTSCFDYTETIVKNARFKFEPSFAERPVKSYTKEGLLIEEFSVITSEGDEIIYAMARDSQGRVYIDNIFSKNSRLTSYGTYAEIINAGMMVYKPEDYDEQTTFIDSKYKRNAKDGKYEDIADFLSLIPAVARYREVLRKRGIKIRATKEEEIKGIK